MHDRVEVEPKQQSPSSPRPGGRRWLRLIGFVLMGMAFMLMFYGAIAYFAWQRGETERLTRLAEQRQTTISRQIELAGEDVADGNFQLALRRLDYVQANDPGNSVALGLRQEAEQGLVLRLTPTVTPTPSPAVSLTPTPPAAEATPDPEAEKEVEEGFNRLEELVDDARWLTAIDEILAFRTRFPEYKRRAVDELLYEAYVNYGLTLTRGSAIERGLYYLELAADLGNLSEQVQGEVFWAEQYLEGIVYYDIDWETYLSYFRPMCEFAPLYQNSCGRLANGLVAYADAYAGGLDWCPAEALYQEALRTNEVEDGTSVREKLTIAAEMCLQATPTPEPTLEGAEETPEAEATGETDLPLPESTETP